VLESTISRSLARFATHYAVEHCLLWASRSYGYDFCCRTL